VELIAEMFICFIFQMLKNVGYKFSWTSSAWVKNQAEMRKIRVINMGSL